MIRVLAVAFGASLLTAASAFSADFAVLRLETVVNAPVDKTWAAVGGWCDIVKWRPDLLPCIEQGPKGIGETRIVGPNKILEIMVAQTAHSYTYAQLENKLFYHGTVAAEPIEGGRTLLSYKAMYDQESDGSPEAKAKDHAEREARWTRMLASMKALSEAAK